MAARLLFLVLALNSFIVRESFAQTAATSTVGNTVKTTAAASATGSAASTPAATTSRESVEKRHARMMNPHKKSAAGISASTPATVTGQ